MSVLKQLSLLYLLNSHLKFSVAVIEHECANFLMLAFVSINDEDPVKEVPI